MLWSRLTLYHVWVQNRGGAGPEKMPIDLAGTEVSDKNIQHAFSKYAGLVDGKSSTTILEIHQVTPAFAGVGLGV